MSNFLESLKTEIKREKNLVKNNLTILNAAPKGFLTSKQREKSVSYFWTFYEGNGQQRKQRQINITHNFAAVLQLAEKKYASLVVDNCLNNLPHLEKLISQYKDPSPSAILQQCAGKYQDIFSLRSKSQIEKWMSTPYSKSPFDPNRHIHVTDYGECVRSKSEQILANSLYAYGIPFRYEAKLQDRNGSTNYVYPDFTIMLPKNKIIIWEHLGMLSEEEYCIKNARKLNFYQQNGFVLGDNLILTMDDDKGNFSSAIINQLIQTQILPKFSKIKSDNHRSYWAISTFLHIKKTRQPRAASLRPVDCESSYKFYFIYFSITIAVPIPPPIHNVASPRCASGLFCISKIKEIRILAPEAPIG